MYFQKVNLSFQPASPAVFARANLTLKVYGATSYSWVGAFDNTDSIEVNATQDTTYELIASNGPCIKDTFITVKFNATTIKPTASKAYSLPRTKCDTY